MKSTPFIVLGSATILAGLSWFLASTALTQDEAESVLKTFPEVDWMSIEDDLSEKVEISWLPLPRFPYGKEGAYAESQLEKAFNVDIKPIMLDESGYGHRKPMLFAAGDIPDVTWNGNPSDVKKDVHHGTIRPIPIELIKKHAPNYYDLINRHAPEGWLYADYDGKNWGLPHILPQGTLPTPGVWRQDWLQAVGIEKDPETLEEFEDAFRRITFDDPDGNGIDDTYGLTNTAVGWHEMFTEFFGAFGVLPFDWMVQDGEVVWGGVTPEAKEVLGVLKAWCKEGLIDPEWVTDGLGGGRRLKEKFINGRVGYAHSLGRYQEFNRAKSNSLISVLHKVSPDAVVRPAQLPIGPRGHRGARNWGAASNILVVGPGVIEEPLKLIRLLKILDYQVGSGKDIYLEFQCGKQRLHWNYQAAESGEVGEIVQLSPYDTERRFQTEVLPVWGLKNPDFEEFELSSKENEFNKTYRQAKHGLLNVLGRPEMVPSAQDYLEDLRMWQLIVYTDIIRGVKPLSYFDEFVTSWKERGGAKMTQEAQQVYERKRQLLELTDGI